MKNRQATVLVLILTLGGLSCTWLTNHLPDVLPRPTPSPVLTPTETPTSVPTATSIIPSPTSTSTIAPTATEILPRVTSTNTPTPTPISQCYSPWADSWDSPEARRFTRPPCKFNEKPVDTLGNGLVCVTTWECLDGNNNFSPSALIASDWLRDQHCDRNEPGATCMYFDPTIMLGRTNGCVDNLGARQINCDTGTLFFLPTPEPSGRQPGPWERNSRCRPKTCVIPTMTPTPTIAPTSTPASITPPTLLRWKVGNNCHRIDKVNEQGRVSDNGRLACLRDTTMLFVMTCFSPVCDSTHMDTCHSQACSGRSWDDIRGAIYTSNVDMVVNPSNPFQVWQFGSPGEELKLKACPFPDLQSEDGISIPIQGNGCHEEVTIMQNLPND